MENRLLAFKLVPTATASRLRVMLENALFSILLRYLPLRSTKPLGMVPSLKEQCVVEEKLGQLSKT